MPEVTPAEPARRLDWDTQFFGRRIARANGQRLTPQLVEALRLWCERNDTECLYFLANADDAPTAWTAGTNGYIAVDIRLTLAKELEPAPEPAAPPMTFAVGTAVPADLAALKDLARISHTDTRFFFDPNFGRERAAELYAIWIERSLANAAGTVLVARDHDQLFGYLALETAGSGEGQIALVAVAPGNQGRGVGRALLAAGWWWLWQHGIKTITVVTQGRNVRALRFYEKAGFQTSMAQIWYHRWFPAAPRNSGFEEKGADGKFE